MSAMRFDPIQNVMGGIVTGVAAFPGDRFSLGIPEAIGDAVAPFWYGTLKPRWDQDAAGLWIARGVQPGELTYTLTVTPAEETLDIDIELINQSPRTWRNGMAFNCFGCGSSVVRDNECLRHWVGVRGKPRRLIQTPRVLGPRPAIQLYSVAGAPKGSEIPFVANFHATPDIVVDPWMAIRAADGKRMVAAVSKPALFLFQNMEYSCIHSGPDFGRLEPGQTGRARTRLYFVEAALEPWLARARADGML